MFGFNHIAIENFREMCAEVEETKRCHPDMTYLTRIELIRVAHKWYNILQRQSVTGEIKNKKVSCNTVLNIMAMQQSGKKLSSQNTVTNKQVEQFAIIGRLPNNAYNEKHLKLIKSEKILFTQDPLTWIQNYDAGFFCLDRFVEELEDFKRNDSNGLYNDIAFIDNVYFVPNFESGGYGTAKRIKIDQELWRNSYHIHEYLQNKYQKADHRVFIIVRQDPKTIKEFIKHETYIMNDSLKRLRDIKNNFATDVEKQHLTIVTTGVKRAFESCKQAYLDLNRISGPSIMTTNQEKVILNLDQLNRKQSERLLSLNCGGLFTHHTGSDLDSDSDLDLDSDSDSNSD